MPVDRMSMVYLGVLLLAVPAQYLISKFFATPEGQRSQSVKMLLSNALGFRNKYFSWDSWHKWCSRLFDSMKQSRARTVFGDPDDPLGESPAVEVFKYKDANGYFSQSTESRSPRSSTVKYRVGQVIRHKIWGYRGIIVGWDPQARAPASWIEQMHGKGKEHWRHQPNYSILVDTRDRMVPQMTYVPQENMEVIVHMPIIHPDIDNYFESFDGAQYIARPYLKTIYPHD